MKGSKYNHGASNKGCKESGSSEYGSPKKIGAGMKKPSPDGTTPAFGKGHANQGGKKKR